jgi:hypothetical protein
MLFSAVLWTFCLVVCSSTESDLVRGVALTPYGSGEKTLLTTRSFRKEEVVVGVLSSMCLMVTRDGCVFHGLQGQLDASFDEVGDLRSPPSDDQIKLGRTWDVQMALALLDATAGTSLAVSGDFYDHYALHLVQPEYLTLPLCMNSVWMLDQIQSVSLKEGAIAQQNRLRSISALFADSRAHRITSAAEERKRVWEQQQTSSSSTSHPPLSPLQWAFAMVRSRCFKVGRDVFAFVPLIDMANHDPRHPAAVFETIADEGTAEFSAFTLRAARDMEVGAEVTISYGDEHDNDRLFVQYGFTMDANPHDSIAWFAKAASSAGPVREDVRARSSELVLSAAAKLSEFDLRVHSASRSLLRRISGLPVQASTGAATDQSAAAVAGAAAVGKEAISAVAVEERAAALITQLSSEIDDMSASFPTTLAVDQLVLERLAGVPPSTTYIRRDDVEQWMSAGSGEGGGGSEVKVAGTSGRHASCFENVNQLRACLRYRIEKKQLLDVAKRIVRLCLSTRD